MYARQKRGDQDRGQKRERRADQNLAADLAHLLVDLGKRERDADGAGAAVDRHRHVEERHTDRGTLADIRPRPPRNACTNSGRVRRWFSIPAASASESTSTLPSRPHHRDPSAGRLRHAADRVGAQNFGRGEGEGQHTALVRQLLGQVLDVVVFGDIGGEVIHRHQRQQQQAEDSRDQLQKDLASHASVLLRSDTRSRAP